MMNHLDFPALGACLCLALAGCMPQKPDARPEVSGETSGSLSRLRLSKNEVDTLEAGARDFFKTHAGSGPPQETLGRPRGDFGTAPIYLNDYRRSGAPRTMRGTTEDLAILPYSAKIVSPAGGADYRSYIIATRPKAGGRWKYDEGSNTDAQKLHTRYPGLKETNAVPPVSANLSSGHPAFRGW